MLIEIINKAFSESNKYTDITFKYQNNDISLSWWLGAMASIFYNLKFWFKDAMQLNLTI